jgi:hypothetical protein
MNTLYFPLVFYCLYTSVAHNVRLAIISSTELLPLMLFHIVSAIASILVNTTTICMNIVYNVYYTCTCICTIGPYCSFNKYRHMSWCVFAPSEGRMARMSSFLNMSADRCQVVPRDQMTNRYGNECAAGCCCLANGSAPGSNIKENSKFLSCDRGILARISKRTLSF